MIQPIVLLTALSLALLQPTDDPVESIKKKITKAEEAHRLELAKTQAEVIKWLDSREATARKKGDKATVNTVKQQREKLETEGTMPKPIPVNTSRKIDTARDLLDATYASLIKEALVANLDELADEIEDKRVQLSNEKLDSNVFKAVSRYAKNLVFNGSFEYPEIPQGQTGTSIATKDSGWKEFDPVAPTSVCRFNGTVYVHGEQSAGISTNASISQHISGLIIGERYVVNGWASTYATPNNPNTKGELKVSIGGESQTVKVSATIGNSKNGYAMPGKNAKWEQFTFVFQAIGETHELQLEHILDGSSTPQILVDQISTLPFLTK